MLVKGLIAGLYEENCYIVMDEATKEAVILDPGGSEERLEKEINDLGAKVKYILLTHGHFDHVGGVDYLAEKFNVPVYINEADKMYMEKDKYVFSDVKNITGYIKDGDTLDFSGKKIKVIHTPGHTKGGVCFLIGDKLFTGDTLFQGSIGRSDFVGGDFNELITSIKTKLMVLDKNIEVYPGHGPKSTIGYEYNNNPFLD